MQYNSYRGKRTRGGGGAKTWLIALLVLVIIGVLGFAGLEVYIGLNSRDRAVGDPQVMVQKLELVIHGSVAAALDRMRTDKPASNGAE